MKCRNCGFETDTNFCPMCGARIENNDSENFINTTDNATAFSDFNSQESFGGSSNPAEVNPYASAPASNSTPNTTYQPPYQNTWQTQNPNPNIGQGNYQIPPMQTPPKKGSGKAAAIIIGCIVGAVIIAGAVIMSISAAVGNSVSGTTTGSISDVYYNPYYYDSGEYITDETVYEIGDDVKTEFGSMALKNIQCVNDIIALDYEKVYPGCDIYMLTFEFTNELEEGLYVSTYQFTATADSEDVYYSLEEVYEINNNSNFNSFYLTQDNTSDFNVAYAVPRSADVIQIEFDYYNYNIDNNDYIYNFTVETEHPASADEG